MSSLKEKLGDILPRVLPDNPDKSINGTELIERIKEKRLLREYEEGSIRSTLTELSKDPTSSLAKVDKGHGFYERGKGDSNGNEERVEISNRSDQLEEKFRSIVIRYERSRNNFPAKIEHTAARRRKKGINIWKFPDLLSLNWKVGEAGEESYEINNELLEVKTSVGDSPLSIDSIELKVDFENSVFRKSFFQCVSNSKWSNNAKLIAAIDVKDEKVAEELRRIGSSYNVSVITYGLDYEFMESITNAEGILNMSDKEFDQIIDRIQLNKLHSGGGEESIDWNHVDDMRSQSTEFNTIFRWIALCLRRKKIYTFDEAKNILTIDPTFS